MATKGNRLWPSSVGLSASAEATSALDFRASNGTFLVYFSGSKFGPAAPSAGGASSLFTIQHSHDKTAWTELGRLTALSITAATARFAAGPYGYVRFQQNVPYNKAQTGSAVLHVVGFMGVT